MKKASAFKFPALEVCQPTGTLIVDPGKVQTLARKCGTYAIGKMLAKHGVPIRIALKVLTYKVVPTRLIVLFRDERISLSGA